MRTSLLVLTVTILPFFSVPARCAAAQAAPNGPRVQTSLGTVQGVTLPSGVRAFRGIPYAAPPVGELRWKPPQPAARWSGVRRADQFQPQCMQARVFADMVFRNAGISEDCLYLNVWSPADAQANGGRPVLVYIYGGGFVAGDGSEPRYDGESMAKRGIVVVTFSHRLGIFGFFSHPELSAESPHHASGNYALMDQTAVLRWVHDNIAGFGGDAARVTIAGESAGSFSVSAQMASPTAKGLFARGIGESGAFFGTTLSLPTLAAAEQSGVAFAEHIGGGGGAKSLADLRALSAMELLQAATQRGAPRFGPNVDGWFFPKPPADIFAAGEQARVPLLAGWNSEESSGRALSPDDSTPEQARAILAQQFGARAADAEKVFPVSTPEEARQSLTDLASDRFIGYSTWKWLEEHARTSGQPVYRYFYAHPRPATLEPDGTPNRGAVHSAEIEYALGNLATNKVFAWSADDFKVSETLEAYFANFIKTGNPNGPGLPEWPVGTVGPGGVVQRMRIDVVSRAEPEPRARYVLEDETRR